MIGRQTISSFRAGSLRNDIVGLSLFTTLSRASGAVRVVVVTSVLGATFLGNTYQTANAVPTMIFELLVSGALTAVLIPSFVRAHMSDQESESASDLQGLAERVLGVSLCVLAPLVVGLVVFREAIFEFAFASTIDAITREGQIRLACRLGIFFAPQLLFYAVGAVSSAVLQSRKRFVAAAVAPVANNVVVIIVYLAYFAMRRDDRADLHLTSGQLWVLGGGTTLGVLAMAAVPYLALVRAGVTLRPKLRGARAELRDLAHDARWAVLLVGSVQLFLALAVKLANRDEGGVVAFTIGATILALPISIIVMPIITGSFPRLAEAASTLDVARLRELTRKSLRVIALTTIPVVVIVMLLHTQIAGAITFGSVQGDGAQLTARYLLWGAPSLLFLGPATFATRGLLAVNRTRDASLIWLFGVVCGLCVAALATHKSVSLFDNTTFRSSVMPALGAATTVMAAVQAFVGVGFLRRRIAQHAALKAI